MVWHRARTSCPFVLQRVSPCPSWSRILRWLVIMTLLWVTSWSAAQKPCPLLQGFCRNCRKQSETVLMCYCLTCQHPEAFLKSEPKVKREQSVISVLLFWCFFSESNVFPCRNTSVSQNLPGEHSIYSLQTGLQYGLAGASRSSSWCSLPSLPEGDSWATSGAECFLSFPWLSSAFCSYKEVTEVIVDSCRLL